MEDGTNNQRRALVVEDDPFVAIATEESLRALGFATLSAPTAQEALEILEREASLDLAMIDVGLPDGRGDELAINARRRHPDLPIIVASGYDSAELKPQFEGDPSTLVLSKPYTESDIALAIAALGVEMLEQS